MVCGGVTGGGPFFVLMAFFVVFEYFLQVLPPAGFLFD
jgi:hypothetical protein